MLTLIVMGESPLLSLKGLLPSSWDQLKDWKKTQSSFNLKWCIYYIWRSYNGLEHENITSPFKSQTPLVNNHIMSYIVKKVFGIDGKVIDRPFLKKQICKQMNENIAEWE